MFSEIVFSNPKPESLIQRVIEMSTKENDIVLDYHLGSGTTAAVAHKMNRQYIGVEQMDYIETVAVERLKKVIDGEQGGISKSINWQGGGEFVYVELKKHNQRFIDQIEIAKDTKAILEIWEDMKTKSFLTYNVAIKKQDEHIEDFKQLPLEEQKQHLVSLLDKNQLYVNRSNINDADANVTEEEIKITKDFYSI
ncbi:site-specific DNA-methyltransferase [Flavobacterium branchiophilum NBRC 15030 = ATCC 35035]|uniref:Methyltransferase n=2 Tax=Flavobacterium branchiophilum TaxID=55197 RepID=A0A543G1S1_9FLAO|nr:site-specific DNA-methyltransferase [Flavobacterium branchiophilum NBRC 15030 = ATCC 35035]TQM40032.1 DNA methylase [Flavobacterium branchiophilum]